MKSAHGFTLVELLVVISIVVILSVIGIVVFTGVQQRARDAKRMRDIDAIFQAMEIRYGQCQPNKYCNLDSTSFAGGGVPQDPLHNQDKCSSNHAKHCGYCFTDFNSQPNGGDDWANNGCPWHFEPEGSLWWGPVDINTPIDIAGNYYSVFILCANLETQVDGKWYYCRKSL